MKNIKPSTDDIINFTCRTHTIAISCLTCHEKLY